MTKSHVLWMLCPNRSQRFICTHLPCLFWLQFQHITIILGTIIPVIICFDLGISKHQPNISKLSLILQMSKLRERLADTQWLLQVPFPLAKNRVLPPKTPSVLQSHPNFSKAPSCISRRSKRSFLPVFKLPSNWNYAREAEWVLLGCRRTEHIQTPHLPPLQAQSLWLLWLQPRFPCKSQSHLGNSYGSSMQHCNSRKVNVSPNHHHKQHAKS